MSLEHHEQPDKKTDIINATKNKLNAFTEAVVGLSERHKDIHQRMTEIDTDINFNYNAFSVAQGKYERDHITAEFSRVISDALESLVKDDEKLRNMSADIPEDSDRGDESSLKVKYTRIQNKLEKVEQRILETTRPNHSLCAEVLSLSGIKNVETSSKLLSGEITIASEINRLEASIQAQFSKTKDRYSSLGKVATSDSITIQILDNPGRKETKKMLLSFSTTEEGMQAYNITAEDTHNDMSIDRVALLLNEDRELVEKYFLYREGSMKIARLMLEK